MAEINPAPTAALSPDIENSSMENPDLEKPANFEEGQQEEHEQLGFLESVYL